MYIIFEKVSSMHEESIQNTPIFIVGCPRSGTTLLRDLLRSHPRITFPRETHFLPLFYKLYGNPKSEKDALFIASKILHLSRVKKWDLSMEAADFAHCRSYAEIIQLLMREWANKEDKIRWGEKTPQNILEIPTLHEIFPNGKFISS